MNKKIKTSIAVGIISFLALISALGTWSINKKISNEIDYASSNDAPITEKIAPETEASTPQQTESSINLDETTQEKQTEPINSTNESIEKNPITETTKTLPPVGKIKCKLKFDDEIKNLNRDEVIVKWSCSDYSGWECTLQRSPNEVGGKIVAKFPSGEKKMYCLASNYSRSTYSNATLINPGINWYNLKCTSREGRIEKFEESYHNYR